ncbi:MAG TPA: glycosyltransferase family 1 protein [Candidatus Acidoferrum sp.]|nr:glycosyltransferase family 1 protein [Candidatus Acidoferrum sp.]
MVQRQLRILHALGTLNPGGVETWLLQVLNCMDRDRLQFHFCTFGPQAGLYDAQVEKLGGRIVRCPKGRNPWAFARRFRKILREGKYDVVHSHVHLFSGALLRWAKAEGVPSRIAHSHTSLDEKHGTLARRYYRLLMKSWIERYATHGLAASRPAAVALFGENWEADGRVRVLHCGIDLSPFQGPIDRDEIRNELGLPLDAPVVGHVGRFDLQKNHPFLLEISGEILKRRPEIHFLLVGDGRFRPEIEAKARAMGVSGNIHFAGIRTDVPRLMRGGMDLFVFPSLWEGLPVTLIEAQAAGLRCIISETITTEANILPQQVIRLSLSTRPEEWAAVALDAVGRGRVKGEMTLSVLAQTDYCVERSTSILSSFYAKVGG